jgi:hypothetical protein
MGRMLALTGGSYLSETLLRSRVRGQVEDFLNGEG